MTAANVVHVDSSIAGHLADLNCTKKEAWFYTEINQTYIFAVSETVSRHHQKTDQLFLALLWQPFRVVAMKQNDGWVRRRREFWGHQLFVILQQSQTEGERLSLTVQHIWKHCRQVLKHHPWGKRQLISIPIHRQARLFWNMHLRRKTRWIIEIRPNSKLKK